MWLRVGYRRINLTAFRYTALPYMYGDSTFLQNICELVKNYMVIVGHRRQNLTSHAEFGCGIGGLGVACWPLVPKFAGSNPAEAVGFLGRKNPQHAFLWRGSKAVGPMS